jgi:pimeloyl-ACP methyl ester carboxylesterase
VRFVLALFALFALSVASPPAARVSADAPARHTAIVEIGGAGSVLAGAEWKRLESLLRGPQMGYGQADVIAYSYHVDPDPVSQAPYSIAESCQPLQRSEQHLAEFLTALQQRHLFDSVTLIGHSQGGVVAMDVLSSQSDLSLEGNPFIRSVIVVDSPLMGLGWVQEILWESFGSGGPCPSVRELAWRHQQPSTLQDYWLNNVGAAIKRGVQVQVVVNNADLYLTPANQSFAGLPVITVVDVAGPNNNHSAAFYDAGTLAHVVGFIGPQGQ